MILYTPLQKTDIFPSEDDRGVQYISHEGRTLCVSETEEGTYELVQLLSSDPQDYLDAKYMPGAIFPKN